MDVTREWDTWTQLFRSLFPTDANGKLTVNPSISPDQLHALRDAAPAMPKEFTLHEQIARYGDIGLYRQSGRMTNGEEFPSRHYHLYLGMIETPVTVPCDLITGSFDVGDALWLCTLAPDKTTRADIIAALEARQAHAARNAAALNNQFAAGISAVVQTLLHRQEIKQQRVQEVLDQLKREA